MNDEPEYLMMSSSSNDTQSNFLQRLIVLLPVSLHKERLVSVALVPQALRSAEEIQRKRLSAPQGGAQDKEFLR